MFPVLSTGKGPAAFVDPAAKAKMRLSKKKTVLNCKRNDFIGGKAL